MKFMIRKQKLKMIIFFYSLTFGLFFARTSLGNKLIGNPFAISNLKFFEAKKDFEGGEFLNASLNKDGGISLKKVKNVFPTEGSYISLPTPSEFPMTEMIPSWNVDIPTSTGIRIDFQVSEDKKNWSGWLYLGRDGDTPEITDKNISTDGATVDVDYIMFSKPFNYFKWRIQFFTKLPDKTPRLKLFTVCYGNSKGDEKIFREFSTLNKINIPEKKQWVKKLNIPYRSQLAKDPEIKEIRGSICCATSLAMLIEYFGDNLTTKQVCDLCYNKDYNIWGSWASASQTLSRFGHRSYVTQIRSFDQIKEYIARDIADASIRR